MLRIDRDTFELSPGRRFSANCGIIGLSQEKDDEEVRASFPHGFDGRVVMDDEDADRGVWTLAERMELAEFMIAGWREWAARQKGYV